MLELLLAVVAVATLVKIADLSERPAVKWGLIAFGVVAVSLIIPLPFLRVMLAFIVVLIAMMLVPKRS